MLVKCGQRVHKPSMCPFSRRAKMAQNLGLSGPPAAPDNNDHLHVSPTNFVRAYKNMHPIQKKYSVPYLKGAHVPFSDRVVVSAWVLCRKGTTPCNRTSGGHFGTTLNPATPLRCVSNGVQSSAFLGTLQSTPSRAQPVP